MKGQKEDNVGFPLGSRMMNSFQSWPGSGPSARNKQLLVHSVPMQLLGSYADKCKLGVEVCSADRLLQ